MLLLIVNHHESELLKSFKLSELTKRGILVDAENEIKLS